MSIMRLFVYAIFSSGDICFHSPSGALRAKITPSPPTQKLRLQSLFIGKDTTRQERSERVKKIAAQGRSMRGRSRRNNPYLSLCSGVNEGSTLSRSSIKMKSFPNPSYLANSIMAPSPIWVDRTLLREERVVNASAKGRKQRTLPTFMVTG